MQWTVYLSGEIHTGWREQIQQGAEKHGLPVVFTSIISNHDGSDAAGGVSAEQAKNHWCDHKTAKVNAIRTKTLIERCDIAVVRFGNKYKQGNAAIDAGMCVALGKPYITLHDESINHPLKDVDGVAMAWAQTPAQVIEVLRYVMGTK